MEENMLNKLHQRAINDAMSCFTNANNATIGIRIGELNALHISAYMNIEETTRCLNNILAYKKELSLNILRCTDEGQINVYAEAIKYADDMIRKILGML